MGGHLIGVQLYYRIIAYKQGTAGHKGVWGPHCLWGPPCLFQNLSFYKINNQQSKFVCAGSILEE